MAATLREVTATSSILLQARASQSTSSSRLSLASPLATSRPTTSLISDFSGTTLAYSRKMPFLHKKAHVGAVNAAVDTVVTEPVTGVQLSSKVTPPGASKELTLLGAGVREKKVAIINVKVYAAALYAEPAVSSSLESFKGKTSDAAFFKALAEAPVDKSLHMVLARDVEGKQFWEALDEALKPRLQASGAGPAGEQALGTFGEALKSRSLKKNTGIYLTWAAPSTLHVGLVPDASNLKATADTVATIDSVPLLNALFDVYLGSDPVSPSLKASISEGAAKLL